MKGVKEMASNSSDPCTQFRRIIPVTDESQEENLMPPGSDLRSKKRRAVFSDGEEDDEAKPVDIGTPGTRDTSSVQKTKRKLALEELEKSRKAAALSYRNQTEISARKEKKSLSDENDAESTYSSDMENEKKDLGSCSFTKEDSESQSSNNLDEEDYSIGSFVVDDSQSQDVVHDTNTGPVVKDGDFIASKEKNENNSHELYMCQLLEGNSKLNLFMMLKNRRKFIATGQCVPITEDTIEDYIGPITVQHCESVDDHIIVQIEDELEEVLKTIISENCGKPLQLEVFQRKKSSCAGSVLGRENRKPSLEEAHERYVQLTLSGLLNSEFLPSLEENRDPYFELAKEVVMEARNSKKSIVDSSAWSKQFKSFLNNSPFLKRKDLPFMRTNSKCQACQMMRNLTESLSFYEERNEKKAKPPVKKFSVGCFCAEKANLYHEIQHYDFTLRKSCLEKLEDVKAMPGLQTEKDTVEHCLNDQDWLDSLFEEFQAPLNKAEKWTDDGKKQKEMKAYCATFH